MLVVEGARGGEEGRRDGEGFDLAKAFLRGHRYWTLDIPLLFRRK